MKPAFLLFLLIYLFLLPANNNLLLSILLYVVVYSRHKMAMMVRFCQTSERICEVDAEILGSSLTDKHLLPSCFVFFNSKCNVPIPAPSHFYFVIVLNGLCASLECRIALKKMLLLLCECVCVLPALSTRRPFIRSRFLVPLSVFAILSVFMLHVAVLRPTSFTIDFLFFTSSVFA